MSIREVGELSSLSRQLLWEMQIHLKWVMDHKDEYKPGSIETLPIHDQIKAVTKINDYFQRILKSPYGSVVHKRLEAKQQPQQEAPLPEAPPVGAVHDHVLVNNLLTSEEKILTE